MNKEKLLNSITKEIISMIESREFKKDIIIQVTSKTLIDLRNRIKNGEFE